MRKNFKNIDITAGIKSQSGLDWQKENGINYNWKTPEQIDVKPVYTKEDLEGMEHLDFTAGIPPFLRGPYSMMYPSVLGQSVSMPDSLRLRRVTHSIVVTLLPDRKVCPLHSTSLRIVAMIQIICV